MKLKGRTCKRVLASRQQKDSLAASEAGPRCGGGLAPKEDKAMYAYSQITAPF